LTSTLRQFVSARGCNIPHWLARCTDKKRRILDKWETTTAAEFNDDIDSRRGRRSPRDAGNAVVWPGEATRGRVTALDESGDDCTSRVGF